MLERLLEREWRIFLDYESNTEGVTFMPIGCNAIYWETLRADGAIHKETLHAETPVTTSVI